MSEIVFASADKKEDYKISKLVKEKRLRKIAPKIYSTNFEDAPSVIIRRNILEILGSQYPGVLLSHRSAFEFKPTVTKQLFVTYTYNRKLNLPGVTINFIMGVGPIEGDNKLIGDLYVSSKERAFLENLQVSRKSGPDSKTLSIPQIEEKLDDILVIHGEAGLNKLRDRAREISFKIDMQKEFEILNRIIGALFTSKPAKLLKSEAALSRAAGFPFDRKRIELFEILFNYLYNKEFPYYPEKNTSLKSFRNFAFFESYFSNYIEGTVFEIEEAKKIIDTGLPLPTRYGDSHDILGTYNLVSSKQEMKHIPSKSDELFDILQRRHKQILLGRPEKNPGIFKTVNNRAGNTHFVDYKLVRGTLKRGFEYYKSLSNPFSCAAFIMFLISEVHPFEDGNGRIARIMMNAELVARDQSKIIIPNVYREDYLLTLKKFTNEKDPVPYTDMLLKIYSFSNKLNFEDFDEINLYLEKQNAFFEPDQGKRLKL